VLRGFTSQTAPWRLLSSHCLWPYPRFAITDQAVDKRLGAAGTSTLERLFEQVSATLRNRFPPEPDSQLVPWARISLTQAATTLDPVTRQLPVLREVTPGDALFLPTKLAGLFDIRRQQWRRTQYIANSHKKTLRWWLPTWWPICPRQSGVG
jgi:hypothetical protein